MSHQADSVASQARQRLESVRARIAAAADRAGRDVDGVTLLGAAKIQSPENVAACVEAGLSCIGENYVQEAREKRLAVEALLEPELAGRLRWHMIGALQRNKARDAVQLFDVIETLDRIALAQELDKRAGALDREIDAFVQVNLSREPQKAGALEEDLAPLLAGCAKLSHLRITGLMTIPAPSPEPEGNRAVFANLRELRENLRTQPGGEALRELSMGMSRDFEIAIEEGATLVRVGTELFGPRPEKTKRT